MKKIYLIMALSCAWIAGMACTNFLVGKDASVDGSTMVSYAADSYALYGFLHHSPAADHPAGAVREVKDWDTGKPLCTIPQVAHTYNVSESDILSNRRTAELVLARQVAMYIARETTDLSYKAIGESFGKDHTTVLYNVNKIEEFLRDKPYQKELVDDLIANLRSQSEAGF